MLFRSEGISLVTFGSFEETTALLNYVQETYTLRQIFYYGQPIAQFPVVNGAHNVSAGPSQTLYAVLPKNTADSELRWDYADVPDTLTAPLAKDAQLSILQVWYGNKCIAQTDLVAINAIPVYTAPIVPVIDRPEETDSGSWTILLIIVGAIAAFFVLYLLWIAIRRSLRIAARNKLRRRRAMNRRRSR